MSGSTHVFIVCSPRARVGKTLAARLITEFYHASARPVAAFDLEPFEPMLAEFLPKLARHMSLNDTRGQMALFDQLVLDDDTAKVIDLGHLALEKFFSVAFDIGFAAEARRRGISALLMYVADQTTTAQNTYSALREKFPDFGFVPVHNDAIARGYELRKHFPALASGVAPLHIPQLSSGLRSVLDRRPFSFAEAQRMPPAQLTQVQRDELEGFIKRTFRELREMELALLMKNLKTSLTDRLRDTGS
jgi:hypothetical protein